MPAAVVLGAYDWAAFGAPWRLSYSYVGGIFAGEQASGLFGIGTPNTFAIVEVFAGTGGLLVVSPVLLLAAAGLTRWGGGRRKEALLAAAVAATFVYVNCSYFLPYGGVSPGPRFLVAGLPFLALGLGPAFAAWPRLTLALATLSVLSTVALSLMWSHGGPGSGGVWGELARALVRGGASQFVRQLPASALSIVGAGPLVGAIVVVLCAVAAFVIAGTGMPWAQIRGRRARSSRRARPSRPVVLVAAIGAYLIVAANTLALTNTPYGVDPQPRLIDLDTTLTANPPTSYPGGEVSFVITVSNVGGIGAGQLFLRLTLSAGLQLAGPPAVTLGSGCSGRRRIVCDLGYLTSSGSQQTDKVYLAVRVSQRADQRLTARATSYGIAQSPASYLIPVAP